MRAARCMRGARGAARRYATTTTTAASKPWSRLPPKQGLYDPALERDSCGVGMVAHLKGAASHEIVRDANTMLVRMAHRGGCGCEPNSGDGAGILTGMPDAFLRGALSAQLHGGSLPAAGAYGAGNIFFPRDPAAVDECKAIFERQIVSHGLELIGWRRSPTDNSALGPTSLASEPHSEMLVVGGGSRPIASAADLNRELYRLRIAAQKAILAEPLFEDFYV